MPKRILQDKLRDLLHYNPATGKFYWRVTLRHASVRVGDEAGSVYSNGYRYIQIAGEDYRAGRLAWFFVTGEDPQDFIDHENRNRDDNSFGNLRKATNSQNQANAFWQTNTSGIKGIRYEPKRRKWLAIITVNGKAKYLGRYVKKFDAAMAYRRAAIEAWGEFAKVPSEEALEELCEEHVPFALELGELCMASINELREWATNTFGSHSHQEGQILAAIGPLEEWVGHLAKYGLKMQVVLPEAPAPVAPAEPAPASALPEFTE